MSHRRIARGRALIVRTVALGVFVSIATQISAQCPEAFRRGDVDRSESINITDALRILQHLFLSGGDLPCDDAADVDDDGAVNLTDAVHCMTFLFLGSVSELPPPFGECGVDPTPDDIGCDAYEPCPPPATLDVCDGVDNDCDGLVDEDTALHADPDNCGVCDRSCSDGAWPNVAEYGCIAGVCFIVRCEEGFYDIDDIPSNGCEAAATDDGTPCDDGNPCTTDDIWIGGICGGRGKDCSELTDACNIGRCDAETGECIAVPRPVNTPCDDGDPATQADRCDGAGNCVGIPIR